MRDSRPVLGDRGNVAIQKIRERFGSGAALTSKLDQQGNAIRTEAYFFEQAAHFQVAARIKDAREIDGQVFVRGVADRANGYARVRRVA